MTTQEITTQFLELLNMWSQEELVSAEIAKAYSEFCLFRNNHQASTLNSVLNILREEACNDDDFLSLIANIETTYSDLN